MSDEIQKVPGAGGVPMATGTGSRFGQKFQKLAQGVTKPMEIPRMFHQLVIFLLDGSGSMTATGRSGRTKGEELHEAMVGVLGRLQKSKNKNCFDISCRVYSTEELELVPQQLVTDIKLDDHSFDPTEHIESEGTYVATTLKYAYEQALLYLASNRGVQCEALIILLSDGDFHDEGEAQEIIVKIKDASITFSTIFYETNLTPAWIKLVGEEYNERCAKVLKRMATNEAFHTSTLNPEEVRKHMINSISIITDDIQDRLMSL